MLRRIIPIASHSKDGGPQPHNSASLMNQPTMKLLQRLLLSPPLLTPKVGLSSGLVRVASSDPHSPSTNYFSVYCACKNRVTSSGPHICDCQQTVFCHIKGCSAVNSHFFHLACYFICYFCPWLKVSNRVSSSAPLTTNLQQYSFCYYYHYYYCYFIFLHDDNLCIGRTLPFSLTPPL